MLAYSESFSGNIKKVIQALVLVLFFVLPMAQRVSSVVIGLILLLSIVGWLGWKKEKVYIHWFLPSLFLYYAISELVSGGTWAPVERRLLFIIVPVIFGINANLMNPTFRRRAGNMFIVGIVVTLSVCLVRAVVRSFTQVDGVWVFNPRVVQESTRDFLSSSVFGGNYFFANDFSPFVDATYFGLYVVFAQYLIFEFLKSPATNSKGRRWLIGAYIFLLLGLFLLSNKATIISSLLLSAYIAVHLLFFARVSTVLRLTVVAGLLLILTLFIFLNPRMAVFKDTFWAGLTINPDARWGHDLRVLSWDASVDVIKENWLFGVGEGNKESALVATYNAKGYVVPAEEKLNSHNQFLDLLIGGGLIGFGLFMTGFVQLAIGAVKSRNASLVAFALLFAFSALFENLLSRYAGILFFAVFLNLLETRRHDS